MKGSPPRLWWLPPLLVGASAAIAAEVAIGILLYSGPGFVRSLTVILGVEGAAFACGLWSAPHAGADLVERLRHRWLLSLFAFLLAAIYGTAWSVVQVLGEGFLGQGIGLAILAGLPLYSAGAVVGGVAVAAHSDPGGRLPGPGAPAAAGAALGFVLTGFLLPRAPMPASLLIGCLIMLSLGGMVFGTVLGARLEVHVRARRSFNGGDVRIEDHILPAEKITTRILLEGPHVRREIRLSDRLVIPWDVAVVRALIPSPESAWRVLLVGGGASRVPHVVLSEHPVGAVDVLERTGGVIELASEHLDTGLSIILGDRVNVEVGHFDDLIRSLQPAYDLVLVDTAALAPVGGVMGVSQTVRELLFEAVQIGGTIAWGPHRLEAGMPKVEGGWTHAEFVRAANGQEKEHVVLTCRGATGGWPPSFDGFHAVSGLLAPMP